MSSVSPIQLKVKVIPRAKKQEVAVLPDGSLKVKVHSAPEKGKANRELIELIAGHFKVNRSSVRIIKGELARDKIIVVSESYSRQKRRSS